MQQRQPVLQPGQALTRLLVMLAFTGLFHWMAQLPGWELAWLGFIVFAIGALRSLVELFQAHRHWREATALRRQAEANSGQFNKGRAWNGKRENW